MLPDDIRPIPNGPLAHVGGDFPPAANLGDLFSKPSLTEDGVGYDIYFYDGAQWVMFQTEDQRMKRRIRELEAENAKLKKKLWRYTADLGSAIAAMEKVNA